MVANHCYGTRSDHDPFSDCPTGQSEVEAVEQEVRRRRGWAAHQRIIARSEAIKVKTGTQPTSTDLIHDLREGEGRRD